MFFAFINTRNCIHHSAVLHLHGLITENGCLTKSHSYKIMKPNTQTIIYAPVQSFTVIHQDGVERKKIKVVTAGIEFRILFIVTKGSYVKWQDYYSLSPHFFR